MWEKQFRIAARQLTDGKYKTVEFHALKALQCAVEANNLEQLAETKALIAELYMETEDKRELQALRDAVGCAERAYGPNSIQLAELLESLGGTLWDEGDITGCEYTWRRALAIREFREGEKKSAGKSPVQDKAEADSRRPQKNRALRTVRDYGQCDTPDGILMLLDRMMNLYEETRNWDELEKYMLKAIAVEKAHYGPTSLKVQFYLIDYFDLLKKQGRHKEADDLATIFPICKLEFKDHDDIDVQQISKTAFCCEEMQAILNEAQKDDNPDDITSAISAYREAADKASLLINRITTQLSPSDPFLELKQQKLLTPYRLLRGKLARLLHLHWLSQLDDTKPLFEAYEILRGLYSDAPSNGDGILLMTVLLDLASIDSNYHSELESTISGLPECASVLYTQALLLFRKHGNCRESRRAVRAALRYNPHVPDALHDKLPRQNFKHSIGGKDHNEALSYVLDGGIRWTHDEQALSFLLDQHLQTMTGPYASKLSRISKLFAGTAQLTS